MTVQNGERTYQGLTATYAAIWGLLHRCRLLHNDQSLELLMATPAHS